MDDQIQSKKEGGMTQNISKEDIRVQKRVPITGSAHITFNAMDEAGGWTNAIAANVSFSGIGVYADKPIPDETDVSIELNFFSSDGQMMVNTIGGTIVYARKIKHLFFTGIEFSEELSAEAHRELYEHIRQSLKWY